MKINYFTLILLFVLLVSACEKEVINEPFRDRHISVNSQKNLNRLEPELKDVKIITENVRLSGDITNLSAFQSVEKIYGKLTISTITGVLDLSGLKNLKEVGSLELHGIENFSGNQLNPIQEVEVKENLYLSDLNLNKIPSFVNVRKLNNLFISKLHNLKEINFLPNLDTVVESIQIVENNKLENTDGIGKVSFVERISFFFNPQLKKITMPNIENIEMIDILGNKNLRSISNMPRLKSNVREILISDNLNLTDISGLSGIRNFSKSLNIAYNLSLDDFCPLKQMTENVFGSFFISGNKSNPEITDIQNDCQ